MSLDDEKRIAAQAAANLVQDDMIVGLGTGSTAAHAVRALGQRLNDGLKFIGVPTSRATETLAGSLGIKLVDPDQVDAIDLTIDGTDEINPAFEMIKGGGAALFREKTIALISAQVAVIADSTKLVDQLGQFPLPIEVVPFGINLTRRRIVRAMEPYGLAPGAIQLRLNADGTPLVTDQGNHILDARFGRITDPALAAQALDHITGIVEHGLFINIATKLVIGRGAEVVITHKGSV
jgi:ribose 5-phosphate isomerase A